MATININFTGEATATVSSDGSGGRVQQIVTGGNGVIYYLKKAKFFMLQARQESLSHGGDITTYDEMIREITALIAAERDKWWNKRNRRRWSGPKRPKRKFMKRHVRCHRN